MVKIPKDRKPIVKKLMEYMDETQRYIDSESKRDIDISERVLMSKIMELRALLEAWESAATDRVIHNLLSDHI